MGFRQRLALFLIATLICVQALTAVFAYGIVRGKLVERGKEELTATAAVFTRQLDVLSERISDGVQVLSLDYALRQAVAEDDTGTALSALKNHGNRIGATRMMLVSLEGEITADSAGANAAGKKFPFGDLIVTAAEQGRSTALAVLDGQIFWMVLVPVRAPLPIAFIAAGLPIDNPLLEKLSQLSSISHSIALATPGEENGWELLTMTAGYSPVVKLVTPEALPEGKTVAVDQPDEHMAMMTRLTTAEASRPVVAILDYSLAEALSTYRAVILPMLLVLAAALVVAVIGAMAIARGLSRPLEELATTARRIARGDYTPPQPIERGDEIGQLSNALINMTHSIATREMSLKDAMASLELARNDAVAANHAKSQFLSNMSHELRTPLNVITGFSEMIHRQVLGPIGVPRYGEYARHVYDSGVHMLSQVNAMLDLSDAETGRLTLNQRQIDSSTILAASVETLAPIAAKAGVELEVTCDAAAWPELIGDGPKLQQGITNLIHNAIKFSKPPATVTIEGRCTKDELILTIRDTGIGISAEDLPVIVRPFHRCKAAFDATHQGAGLGLPFAKTIVELHGGAFDISSTPNIGTTVTIRLPLLARATSEEAA